MKLEDVVKVIKDQIIECKNIGSMFDMPSIDGINVEKKTLQREGTDLVHFGYDILLPNDEYVHIDYHSKDKCRVFQIEPDRSVISLNCSDPKFNFSDSWDEKC